MKPSWPMNPHSYGARIGDFGARIKATNLDKGDPVYGLPLNATEYKWFFEVIRFLSPNIVVVFISDNVSNRVLYIQSQIMLPEAEYLGDSNDPREYVVINCLQVLL